MKDSPLNFSAYRTIPQPLSILLQSVSSDIHSLQRKGNCESVSLASLRSRTTMNINVVKLSLNEKSLSWLLTCVAYQLSRVSSSFGSRTSAFFSVFPLSLESRLRDTGYIFALRSWWTTVTCPSRHLLHASRAVRTCRST